MIRALVTIMLSAATAAAAAPSSGPIGQFIVVAAPRHPTVSNSQASYRPDDPRLVNRIVAFEGASADFDGVAIGCARAIRTTTPIAAGQLIRRIFPN